jgi:transcription-repair coupling factor (superfamily II helicase)
MKDPVPRPAELGLWSPLLGASFFRDIVDRLGRGERNVVLNGLIEGARSLGLSLLAKETGRPLLVVVPDDAALATTHRNISALARLTGQEPKRIVLMPALDADPYSGIAPHPEVVRERVVALIKLARGEVDVLLTPARALLNLLPSPDEWMGAMQVIRCGDTLPPDKFVLHTMGLGYRRVDTVSAPGEVSRRGGIIDVFSPTADEPVRIELFGDTVESVRAFDTDHQRSTGQLEEAVVGPALESLPGEAAMARLSAYLEGGIDVADDDRVVRGFRARLEQLQEEGFWAGMEALAGVTVESPTSLVDHAADFLLVVEDADRTEEMLARAWHDIGVGWEESGDQVLPEPSRLYGDPKAMVDRLRETSLQLSDLPLEDADSQIGVNCRPARVYSGRIPDLIADLRAARDAGERTVCVMRARGSAERLMEIFKEYELHAVVGTDGFVPGDGVDLVVVIGALRTGFEFPDLGLRVLSEREVFGEQRPAADRKATKHAAFISDFRDLKRGDYVVHVDHGVAQFAGLGRPKGGSLNRDFMLLEFAGRDKLFVPVDRLDLVQRYSGVAGRKASLDKLGGPGWDRVKSKVRKSVQLMARELLELYARRASAKGHRFSPDTPWQKELEDAFPFELTPDQERVVTEIKEEMESERAMDRLLVGDVGFGKTEVAVRAAFKAVMDGFQVAMLTPTTVLAVQHFETLSKRFAPFPVRVEMVSRFRSATEIRKTVEDTGLGQVDVLIGTHRMLSKDVSFKNLGLMIVDEEQRFGVAHKERLKKMSVGVDVLSMTATPIPRTLQMSLAGVRDLSIIETPPPGRMAIQTYLIPFRTPTLAQAIRQEIRRDGQVFVVNNRIETLATLAKAVSEMVPEARVVVAHGQMPERKLEEVMLKFMSHEADVLVTTTIIENGLDIPRANTMIVNRADQLGLAQLYQLRGRVGRSHNHAYAYFVIPDRRSLTDEARKRLKALQDFSELGAGFRLAAADLEIRGAGEMLGPRQHGHIAALGFDLYCQMLERTVQELKGEPVPERRPPTLHLGVDIKVPESYLPDAGDRLALYKRLAQAQELSAIERIEADTEDRFGHLPGPAQNLFGMTRVRLVAETLLVKSIDLAEDKLQIRFHEAPPIEPQAIVELVARERGSLTPSGMLILPAPPRGEDRIQAVHDLLTRMRKRTAS